MASKCRGKAHRVAGHGENGDVKMTERDNQQDANDCPSWLIGIDCPYCGATIITASDLGGLSPDDDDYEMASSYVDDFDPCDHVVLTAWKWDESELSCYNLEREVELAGKVMGFFEVDCDSLSDDEIRHAISVIESDPDKYEDYLSSDELFDENDSFFVRVLELLLPEVSVTSESFTACKHDGPFSSGNKYYCMFFKKKP